MGPLHTITESEAETWLTAPREWQGFGGRKLK